MARARCVAAFLPPPQSPFVALHSLVESEKQEAKNLFLLLLLLLLLLLRNEAAGIRTNVCARKEGNFL